MSSAKQLISSKTFFLDSFALRQWDDKGYSGPSINYDKKSFVTKIQSAFDDGSKLVDGYAPFCKHIFVPNFVGAKSGSLLITPENEKFLKSGYTKRRPEELAVLTRWFVAGEVPVPESKFLDIILYSREQLLLEYEALPPSERYELPDAPWGIISIKAQDEDYETPMQPITMLRNALGREEGGSGVKLDREAYAKSVAYWESHATISETEKPKGE
eukprot:CAMPEP_0175045328 /NCGR_PEP_ID=MMETSP0052_2-20121109/4350_1 /TAXON_ID=51329 ORGANISM="Polytomella parva, Strain SAG 63-3" /NCGR_SAMPLE_ID=MMETSP0052_2 /ASSEMBLY_ACC=CAM_ASM_000194 /LENGTH=214 /DNA_ID=CAMNT_0016308823 /DNA_START=42 /DNA_END=686 /DNA_ORIENTATION=+